MAFDDNISSASTSSPTQNVTPPSAPQDQSAPAPQFTAPASTQAVSPNGAQPAQPSATSNANSDIVSNRPAEDPNANHPLVQRAGIVRSAAQALAGGPRYTERIDENGNRILTPVKMSGRDIAMAIALQAIQGSLTGLAAGRGRGAGAAGAAAMSQAMQQRQQQQQRQDQQAQQDVENRNAALARHYQVAEANMRMLSLAQTIGRADQELHDNVVKMSADQLKGIKDNTPESIVAERLSEDEAKDLNRYPLNEYTRIPDGVTPRLDSNGNQVYIDTSGRPVPEGTPGAYPASDNTYSLVHKNAKVALTSDGIPSEFVKQGVEWGLLDKSWLKAAPTSEMSAPLAATLSRKVDSLNAAKSDLDKYYASLNASSKADAKYTPVDLKAELQKDPTLPAALDKFQGIFNATGSREAAIGELAKKDPKAAGKVARLYGGRDALHDFDVHQKLKDLQLVNNAELDKERSLIPIRAATAGAEEAARVAANPQNNDPALTTPDALGFAPHVPGGLKEYNKRQGTFKKNADDLAKSEGTFQQFQSIIKDISNGRFTGAESVVGLFDAIGISATPLAGRGFRVNNNVIQEHAQARGWAGALQQKLLNVKAGDVITPQQLKDYADIAAQARESQYVNLVNQVHNQGLNADFVLPTGNGQTLDQSTARIFLQLSGNDAAKAAAAAKTKGWVIP